MRASAQLTSALAAILVPLAAAPAQAFDEPSLLRKREAPVVVVIDPDRKHRRDRDFSNAPGSFLGKEGPREESFRNRRPHGKHHDRRHGQRDVDNDPLETYGKERLLVDRDRHGPKIIIVSPGKGGGSCGRQSGVCVIRP